MLKVYKTPVQLLLNDIFAFRSPLFSVVSARGSDDILDTGVKNFPQEQTQQTLDTWGNCILWPELFLDGWISVEIFMY